MIQVWVGQKVVLSGYLPIVVSTTTNPGLTTHDAFVADARDPSPLVHVHESASFPNTVLYEVGIVSRHIR